VYQVSTLAGAAGMTGFADQPGAAARFSTPLGIAVAPDGDVLVSDNGNAIIRRINVATGAVSTLAGVPQQAGFVDGPAASARFRSPQGLAVDKTGTLYVADSTNSVIRKVDLAGGMVSTVVGIPGVSGVKLGPLPGRLNSPAAVAVLPSGLLISDQFENAVLYAR
jgi:streptogramin lyase